jgi:hypothetical protein
MDLGRSDGRVLKILRVDIVCTAIDQHQDGDLLCHPKIAALA